MNKGNIPSWQRPGTMNVKVMKMDVDIRYEVKMDRERDSANKQLGLGIVFGWVYEDETWSGVRSSAGHMRVKTWTRYDVWLGI